ncbi:Small integral membrane protein 8 [Bulinus truncatus]|nr:Small integral membrane protein 8 [Bulinus truncatus]
METQNKSNKAGTESVQNLKQPLPQDHVTSTANSSVNKNAASKTPATGWASMPSTSLFRAVNFELYVKPNKVAMICGVAAFSSCVAYIAYMNLKDTSKKETYVTLDVDGGTTRRPKTSRWD